MSSVGLRKRSSGIDLIRCLSAWLVFSFHYVEVFKVLEPGRSLATVLAPVGTNLLILLSGYFCALTRAAPKSYTINRICRLLIPLWVVLSAYLCIYAVRPELSRLPQGPQVIWYLLLNLLSVAHFAGYHPISTVTWTIGLVLWPAVAFVHLRKWPLVLLLCAAVAVTLAPRFLSFVIGVAFALLPAAWLRWVLVAITTAAGLPFAAIPAALFLILKDLSVHKFVTVLGSISYSVYLCHPLALHAVSVLGLAWSYPISLTLSLMLATALYHVAEVPARQFAEVLQRPAEESVRAAVAE